MKFEMIIIFSQLVVVVWGHSLGSAVATHTLLRWQQNKRGLPS
jgi:pimeloyl-ACP methyl ester carboxylesterase